MDSCPSCSAALTPAAQWCGQCYAVIGGKLVAQAPPMPPSTHSIMSPVRPVQTAKLPTMMIKTRWKKTDTTFGPVGRMVATFALVVPFIVFVALAILSGGLIIGAPVIWGFIIMPWGLRDTWKAGSIPAA